MLATTTNNDIALIVAIVLFCIAGVIRFSSKNFDSALVAFGLAVFALAFLINP